MSKPTDMRICEARWCTEQIDYRTPMKFGGRVVREVMLMHVRLDIETRDGRRGSGLGSMPLGNVWAWPSQQVTAEQTLQAMADLGRRAVAAVAHCDVLGDPLQISRAWHQQFPQQAARVAQDRQLVEPLPALARLVATSPLEAALYDAWGKTLGRNCFQLLGSDTLNEDLGAYLGTEFAGEYPDRYTLSEGRPRMPLYHLVGALDPLTDADVQQKVDDGLPETLAQWIPRDGLTHLKIKLNGDDLPWDVERVVAIDRVASDAPTRPEQTQWRYSLDFNERCANVAYVVEMLSQLRQRRPEAWNRIQYIEQPTHRDLRAHPENRMHEAAAIKPVVIDESLIDYESLLLSREAGYSGVALKACKGHSEALLMAAAAIKHQMFLCVQDLTCPGASFLHSAALASHIPTVAAIEGNGRQYCPRGNRLWDQAYPEMFRISDGTLGTHRLHEPGLGFHWPFEPPWQRVM